MGLFDRAKKKAGESVRKTLDEMQTEVKRTISDAKTDLTDDLRKTVDRARDHVPELDRAIGDRVERAKPVQQQPPSTAPHSPVTVSGLRAAKATSVSATLYEGEPFGNSWDYSTEIVGESNYQPALKSLAKQGPREEIAIVLVPEPDNKYDTNAVAAFAPTGLVGYLPRDHAKALQRVLIDEQRDNGGSPIAVFGKLVGGTDGKSLGIYLALPEEWS
jgi:hypothetical protein